MMQLRQKTVHITNQYLQKKMKRKISARYNQFDANQTYSNSIKNNGMAMVKQIHNESI